MTGGPENIAELAVTSREGVWCATTLNGSAYVIDFGEMTVRRTPDPNDDDEAKNLRKDGEERPLLGIDQIAIGSDMIFILDIRGDGTPTTRWTSPVIRIERVA
ncbi:hypothetical protein [Frondihabitans cladoniiphilus]|uniref:Phytase-like domain-containing protein n=1 Tax=Frondihabitans cladoniiphilus TaxID=715785 RepID=A0ABP8VLU8_9MICO